KHTLQGHSKSINMLAIDVEGRYLLSGGDDGFIIIWDLASGKIIHKHSEVIHGQVTAGIWIDSSAGSKALLFSSADGTLHRWRQGKKEACCRTCHARHDGVVEGLDFDHFHRRLATVGSGVLALWAIHDDWKMERIATSSPSPYISRTVHFVDQGNAVIVTFLESHEMFVSGLFTTLWLTSLVEFHTT
ncbi:hypothetical protein JAAARDRAFT_143606, partial [Jaapia argillacea MUCL 33604]